MADLELFIFVGAACFASACVASAVTYKAVHWSRDRQAENDDDRRETAIDFGLKLAQENQALEQRVTGPTKTVELFDGAQLAEWREQAEHVCTYECAGQGCNDPQPERPCNGCGKAARFAWDDDGVPRAACNFCVSLWFEDGLPAHVRRISDDGSADAEDDPATFPRPLFGGRGRR